MYVSFQEVSDLIKTQSTTRNMADKIYTRGGANQEVGRLAAGFCLAGR
jgi:hypothetical protein